MRFSIRKQIVFNMIQIIISIYYDLVFRFGVRLCLVLGFGLREYYFRLISLIGSLSLVYRSSHSSSFFLMLFGGLSCSLNLFSRFSCSSFFLILFRWARIHYSPIFFSCTCSLYSHSLFILSGDLYHPLYLVSLTFPPIFSFSIFPPYLLSLFSHSFFFSASIVFHDSAFFSFTWFDQSFFSQFFSVLISLFSLSYFLISRSPFFSHIFLDFLVGFPNKVRCSRVFWY